MEVSVHDALVRSSTEGHYRFLRFNRRRIPKSAAAIARPSVGGAASSVDESAHPAQPPCFPGAAGAGRFRGLAQVGLVAFSKESYGAQIGAAALSSKEHDGVQLGVLANYARSINGAQLGLVNVAEKVRGFQIGLVNHTESLRGLQVGLVNHAEDGVLPWTALLNMGFGDGDGGATGDDDEDAPANLASRE